MQSIQGLPFYNNSEIDIIFSNENEKQDSDFFRLTKYLNAKYPNSTFKIWNEQNAAGTRRKILISAQEGLNDTDFNCYFYSTIKLSSYGTFLFKNVISDAFILQIDERFNSIDEKSKHLNDEMVDFAFKKRKRFASELNINQEEPSFKKRKFTKIEDLNDF